MAGVAFFAYGSFSEGMVHFDKIKNFIQTSQKATIKGTAYRLQVGYPVLLEDGSSEVQGHLVVLEDNSLLLKLLDELHGCDALNPQNGLHIKKEGSVRLQDGTTTECSVYFLNPTKLPKSATLIEGRDWSECLHENPIVTRTLTDRQKTYIKKLGQSSGRDIVPIDLNLYRELMSLEIIRDKGRRLALTNFGCEVYRYLD